MDEKAIQGKARQKVVAGMVDGDREVCQTRIQQAGQLSTDARIGQHVVHDALMDVVKTAANPMFVRLILTP
jgi:hypothetical protein